MDIIVSQINESIRRWTFVRDTIRARGAHGKYYEEELRYRMMYRYFTDWSLVFDHEIFEFKPPVILRYLWTGNLDTVTTFITAITDWEIKQAKIAGVMDLELGHVLDLKDIAHWTLKNSPKFKGLSLRIRRKTLAGDYRPIRMFTIKDYSKNA